MEASALHAPAVSRLTPSIPLLRLRSDEQLVGLFRTGSEDAFAAIHDRYRQRLFAYVRQMLSSGSRADAEDVLQDVFVRAYGALRADQRDVNLRAWLYRVAHNRCIDHLRRPTPPAAEIFDLSRTPLQDPMETAQRRDDLKRLVEDVGRLPEQQRSALLMREIDGLAYTDIAGALDVTVPAVKSLLVRARVGLVEAAEARDTACSVIREDLAGSYDRGVKASGRARRHLRECDGCREYRTAMRGMRRSFAALTPAAGLGPLAVVAKALGLGGAGGGAGAGVVGGGAGAIGGTAAACKVAAVVCTAVVATGGVAEVKHLTAPNHASAATASAPRHSVPAAATTPISAGPVSSAALLQRADRGAVLAPQARSEGRTIDHETAADAGGASSGAGAVVEDVAAAPATQVPETTTGATTGGVSAPTETQADSADEAPVPQAGTPDPKPEVETPPDTGPTGTQGGSGAPAADPATTGGTPPPSTSGPSPEH